MDQGESKTITVNVKKSEEINIGSYDLSLLFLPADNPKECVSAKTSTSIRLKFLKAGVIIASLNVTDVQKPSIAPFHVIFANIQNKNSAIDSTVTIISEKDNKIVGEFKQLINMNLYPKDGFYGTMKIPWSTENIEMGDYKIKVNAISSDGTIITAEKQFQVELSKGKLLKVEVDNVRKGNPANIVAQVKNTGNLKLPATFNIVIKNKSGEKIFEDKKTATVLPEAVETISIK